MIAISGATGRLGQIVVAVLREKHPDRPVVALARDIARAAPLQASGAAVRAFDYDRPETLSIALDGVERLLLISGNAVGQRERQHRAVAEAAKAAGVGLLGYTSVLRASETSLAIAEEHRLTEAALAETGVPHVLLRHGWYNENFVFRVKAAIESGDLPTCAGDGLISGASRRDYAEAAVAILTSDQPQAAKVYELAGSSSYTFADLAAHAERIGGRPVAKRDVDRAEMEQHLIGIGLPAFAAAMVVKSDLGAQAGGLFDDSRTLERVIGRPTTSIAETLDEALG